MDPDRLTHIWVVIQQNLKDRVVLGQHGDVQRSLAVKRLIDQIDRLVIFEIFLHHRHFARGDGEMEFVLHMNGAA